MTRETTCTKCGAAVLEGKTECDVCLPPEIQAELDKLSVVMTAFDKVFGDGKTRQAD